MAHFKDSGSKTPTRWQIDLFDPHQAARRLSTTSLYPSTTLGTPHPLRGSTVSSSGGIRPFQPASDDVGGGSYPYQPRPQAPMFSTLGSSTMTQSLKPPNVPPQTQAQDQAQSVRKSGRRRPRQGVRSPDFRYVVASSSIIAGLILVGDVTSVFQEKPVSNVCEDIVQPDAVLSREMLSQVLTIPERNNKAAVREIVNEPYCVLPSIDIRAGATAEREAYPLAFDPQTWLVLLYEGDDYAGYSFSFQP